MKNLKIVIAILLSVLLSLIAFWGVFTKEKGVWKNLVPDYQYGMDLEGARELRYALDDSEEEKYVYVDENGTVMGEVWKDGSATTAEDEASSEEEGQAEETETEEEQVPYAKETRTIKVNSDDKLTKENFEKAKKIIQERLKAQGVAEYNIRIDDVTGKLVVETSNDNENVDLVQNLVESAGKFQIIDYQNGLVLMDNSDIKKVSAISYNEDSYNTYLQIEFNKEGAEKLREISTKYVEIENETEEQNEENAENEEEHNHDEETEKKYVSIVMDDTTMMTTYFGEEMTNGMLQLTVGQARTNPAEAQEDYASAQTIADILNSETLPITYQLETDNFVKSEYAKEDVDTLKIIAVVTIVLASFILIVKFRKSGFLAAFLSIGYIALLSIVARYTNVVLTENSMIAYSIIVIMNYIAMKMVLKAEKEGQIFDDAMKKFYLTSIPLGVIAIVFTFSKYTAINSIGMILFWGVILNVLYNIIVTRTVLKK